MRLAIISTVNTGKWEGSEELWLRIALAAQSHGHLVDVFCNEFSNFELPSKISRSERPISGFVFSKVGYYLNRRLGIFFRIFEEALSFHAWNKALAKKKYQHVIISQGGPSCSLHETGLLKFLNNSNTPFSIIVQQVRKNERLNESWRKSAIQLYQQAQNIIFVSSENKECLEMSLAHKINNFFITPNPCSFFGVTGDSFWPRSDCSQQIRVACVGRLEIHDKGQDILLRSLKKASDLGANILLNLYGSGADLEYIKRLAVHLSVRERVRIHGFVSSKDDIWSDNHLLVMPSRCEGCPVALAEAFYYGRPAIVTDVGGGSLWVNQGTNGWVCESESVNSLTDSLLAAWTSRHRLMQMGASARTRYLEINPEKSGEKVLSHILSNIEP